MAGQGNRSAILNPRELEQLTESWQIWAESAPTAARSITRARMHLFFLLIRFAGLRPGEITAMQPASACDLNGGVLNLDGRCLFLPASALRALRRILTLPECTDPAFLRLDSGFVRRTFYAVAELAALAPASCAPMALRYARARELLAMNIPAHLVAKTLGFRSPLQITALGTSTAKEQRSENTFPALVKGFELGNRSACVLLALPGNVPLHAIMDLERLFGIEPTAGQMLELHVPPGSVNLADELPLPNSLSCRIVAVDYDKFDIRLRLMVRPGLELTAALDRRAPKTDNLRTGDKITITIPAHAIRLQIPNSPITQEDSQ